MKLPYIGVKSGEIQHGFQQGVEKSNRCGLVHILAGPKQKAECVICSMHDHADFRLSYLYAKDGVVLMSGSPLMGTYNHTMDAKGRMAFPTKLREQLGEGFVITIGLEGCLYVYSGEEWERFTEKLRTLSGPVAKQAIRKYAANAVIAEADKQGRVLIPQNLREHAGLTREVTVIGNLDRAEIWDSKRYEDACAKFSDEELSAALDSLAF